MGKLLIKIIVPLICRKKSVRNAKKSQIKLRSNNGRKKSKTVRPLPFHVIVIDVEFLRNNVKQV